MKKAAAVLAILASSGMAFASTVPSTLIDSVTFLNKASVDAQGDVDNAIDSYVAAASGTVNSIRVIGSLTEVATATFANEARVRISAGAGSAFTSFNVQATTAGGYTGTLAINNNVPAAPFALTAGGIVNFEWFEAFQDGTAGLSEQNWDSVTYEFRNVGSVMNGGSALGSLPGNGVTQTIAGSHVAGGLDFFTFTIPTGVTNISDYLNIRMLAGATGSMTDTEIALYDSLGNLVVADDDGSTGLFSALTFGAADPLQAVGDDLAGSDGLTLASGTYTIVTGGFNTLFGATIDAITPGTNAGSYNLLVTYVPAPGALALMGLGGLVAARRRRA